MSADVEVEDFAEERAAIAEEFRFRNNPAEMKQKYENEPWFQTIKSIIQNNLTTMTISEIKELNGILTVQLCERERATEWAKTNQDGNSDLELPPLPYVAFQQIFSSLPTKDILTCRLVCQDWKPAATMELRKRVSKCFTIKCLPLQQCERRFDRLTRFMEVMKESQLLPIVSFHLVFEDIAEPGNCAAIQGFFRLFGPFIQDLTLDVTELIPMLQRLLPSGLPETIRVPLSMDPHKFYCSDVYLMAFRKYFGSVQLERLQNLEFIFDRRENEITDCPSLGELGRNTVVMRTYFATAENLRHVRYISQGKLLEFVNSLLSLQPRPLAHLTRLTLECHVLMESELVSLGQLKLTRLSLKVGLFFASPAAMKVFLQRQAQSLKYLKLFSYEIANPRVKEESVDYFPEFLYEFPKMDNLRVLSIEWNDEFPAERESFRCAPINWLEYFPELVEFKMRGEIASDCLKCLFPKDKLSMKTTHKKLQIFEFPVGILTAEVQTLDILAIQSTFSNVHTIKVPFEEFVGHHMLFPVFSNKKLVLHAKDENYIENDEETFVSRKMCVLKDLVWKIELSDENIEYYCERLTSMAIEIKTLYSRTRMRLVRKEYDCAWFLRHLRERVKLEKIVAEQRKADEIELDSNSSCQETCSEIDSCDSCNSECGWSEENLDSESEDLDEDV